MKTKSLPLKLKKTFPPIFFKFSLKVKVMRSNPGHLLKYFLLYKRTKIQKLEVFDFIVTAVSFEDTFVSSL